MPNDLVSRRQSIIVRFTRRPDENDPVMGWNGILELVSIEEDAEQQMRGFTSLVQIPSKILELLSDASRGASR